MKKLFLLIGLLFCFSTVYGGIWNKKKTTESGSGLFGSNSGNQTNISMGDSKKGTSTDDRLGGSEGKLANESKWNFDLEGLGMMMPHQPAKKGFLVGPISIGSTYKFSEAFHIVYKYVTFEIPGVELDGAETDWVHEHHLLGFGFRRFISNNEYQFIASVGSGSSKVEEKSGAITGDFEAPIWADISFAKVIDDFSVGVRFSFMELDSKEDKFEDYLKGGYSFVGVFVQFGIPGI